VLAATAGRQQGPSVATFVKLMRARDWTLPEENAETSHGESVKANATQTAAQTDHAAQERAAR